jgi:hypothetical protein
MPGGSKIPTPLSSLFPAPEPATLAGRTVLLGQLRVADLVELERRLAGLVPHPRDGLPAAADDPDPATRPARLRAAARAAREWPPAFGGAACRDLLATPAGAGAYLLVALNAHDDVPAEDAAEVAERMTAADWATLDRIAWGVPPWEELEREAAAAEGLDDPPDGDLADWGEVVYAAIREARLSYDQVLGLYVGQLQHLRRRGLPCEGLRGRTFRSLREARAWQASRGGAPPAA